MRSLPRTPTEQALLRAAEDWIGGVMEACALETPAHLRDDPAARWGIVLKCRLSKSGNGVWFHLDNGRATYRPSGWIWGRIEALCE